MTRLPPPEQWVLCMSEMEVAEMIEKYIDFKLTQTGNRSVHSRRRSCGIS